MSDEKSKDNAETVDSIKDGESLDAVKAGEAAADANENSENLRENASQSKLAGSPNFKEVENLDEVVQAAFDSTTVDEEYWNEMSQERRDKVIQRTLDGLKS